jgi:hypothetical protein
MIQWAKAIGVNNSSILKGKTFINLPSICLYQSGYKLVIAGRRLVENQYCVGSLPSILGLDQGVGLDGVQIEAKTLNFK